MKKAFITLFAITLSLGVFAQDSSMNNMASKHRQNHEGVIMKNGKLLMMKNGQTTQLTSDLTLDNGTVVMANGTVKSQDGTITTLKEGDYVGMDGKIGNSKWSKNKMGTDSTMTNKMSSDSVK